MPDDERRTGDHDRRDEVTISESSTKLDLKTVILLGTGLIIGTGAWAQLQFRVAAIDPAVDAKIAAIRADFDAKLSAQSTTAATQVAVLSASQADDHRRLDREFKMICSLALKMNTSRDPDCP